MVPETCRNNLSERTAEPVSPVCWPRRAVDAPYLVGDYRACQEIRTLLLFIISPSRNLRDALPAAGDHLDYRRWVEAVRGVILRSIRRGAMAAYGQYEHGHEHALAPDLFFLLSSSTPGRRRPVPKESTPRFRLPLSVLILSRLFFDIFGNSKISTLSPFQFRIMASQFLTRDTSIYRN